MSNFSSMPIQIRCIECANGTLMNRVPSDPGDTQNAKYQCVRLHIRKLRKITSSHVWSQPPNDAA